MVGCCCSREPSSRPRVEQRQSGAWLDGLSRFVSNALCLSESNPEPPSLREAIRALPPKPPRQQLIPLSRRLDWTSRAVALLVVLRRKGVPASLNRAILGFDEEPRLSLVHVSRQSHLVERRGPSFNESKDVGLGSDSNVVSVCSAGQWLCCGDAQGVVAVISGGRSLTFRAAPRMSAVTCMTPAFRGTILTGGADGRLRLWRIVDGALLWESPAPAAPRPRAAGLLAEIAGQRGRPVEHPATVCGVCFDRPRAIALTDRGRVELFRFTDRDPGVELRPESGDCRKKRPLALADNWLAADDTLYSLGGDDLIRAGAAPPEVVLSHAAASAFLPALGRHLWVLADGEGRVSVLSVPSCLVVARLDSGGLPTRALAVDPRGRFIAVSRGGSESRQLAVWAVNYGNTKLTFFLRFRTALDTNSLGLAFFDRRATHEPPQLAGATPAQTTPDADCPTIPKPPIVVSPPVSPRRRGSGGLLGATNFTPLPSPRPGFASDTDSPRHSRSTSGRRHRHYRATDDEDDRLRPLLDR